MKPTPKDQMFEEPEAANSNEKEMSFFDHLEELRWHVIRVLSSIAVFGLIAFFMKSTVMAIILGPMQPDFLTYEKFCELSHFVGLGDRGCITPAQFTLEFRNLPDAFFLHLKVSFFIGLIFSFPYLLWELWRFISPGLYDHERNQTRGIVLFGSVLFLTGAAFGYFFLAPFGVNFFANYTLADVIVKDFTIESYISIVTSVTFAAGMLFELPIVILLLAKIGVLSSSILREYRRHAFVAVLIVSAILTPADPFSQVFVSIPVYFLYEFSILLAEREEKKRAKREMAESAIR